MRTVVRGVRLTAPPHPAELSRVRSVSGPSDGTESGTREGVRPRTTLALLGVLLEQIQEEITSEVSSRIVRVIVQLKYNCFSLILIKLVQCKHKSGRLVIYFLVSLHGMLLQTQVILHIITSAVVWHVKTKKYIVEVER